MKLDDKKFEDFVCNDNDIGSILKLLRDILCKKESGGNSINTAALDMVTLHDSHSKGSVELARGMISHLSNKKLTHRNSVVRDVNRELSMRGIEIDSNNYCSASSDCDQEHLQIEQREARDATKCIRTRRKHREAAEQKSQTEIVVETTLNSAGKFRAAARIAKILTSTSSKDARKGLSSKGNRTASEDIDTVSVSSKDTRRSASRRPTSMHGLRNSLSGSGSKPANEDRNQSSGGNLIGKIRRNQSMAAETSLEHSGRRRIRKGSF